jgi:hypothetical protein
LLINNFRRCEACLEAGTWQHQDSRNKLNCGEEISFMVGAGFICDGISVPVAVLMDIIKINSGT